MVGAELAATLFCAQIGDMLGSQETSGDDQT
jgi:hypothetical protein